MDTLPQDCIAKILSLTSPRDVCRSSAVSTIFKSAADSDHVWNQFLPSDFPQGFVAPKGLPTRKRLFFSLVDNPLLLHDAPLSFSLERTSGKKCYMIAPTALIISWGDDVIPSSHHEVRSEARDMEIPQGPVTRAKAKMLTEAIERMFEAPREDNADEEDRVVTLVRADQQDQESA